MTKYFNIKTLKNESYIRVLNVVIFLFLQKIEEKIIIILRQLHHFVFAHFKPLKISKYVFYIQKS